MVIGFSADQATCHPFVALWMGVQSQVLQSISDCRDNGGLLNIVGEGSLGISSGRKLSDCPRFSGVGDSGVSGMGVLCWHN